MLAYRSLLNIGVRIMSRFGNFVRSQTILYNQTLRIIRSLNRVFEADPELLAGRLPPTGTIEESLGAWGRILIPCGDGWGTSATAFWNRSALAIEPEMSALFGRIAEQSDVIVDCGANWGFYTMLASRANPKARVLSFEPNPHSASALMKTVSINNSSNVEIFSLALSDHDGSLTLTIPSGSMDSGATTLMNAPTSKHGKMEKVIVSGRSLDSLKDEMNLGRIDLIKLDTEGTEHLIVRGSQNVLDDCRPILFIEILPNHEHHELETTLRKYGYRSYHLTHNGPVESDSVKGVPGLRNYLFVHPDNRNTGLI